MTAYYILKHIIIRKWIKNNKLLKANLSICILSIWLYSFYYIGLMICFDVSSDMNSEVYRFQNFLLLTVRFFSPAFAIIAVESYIYQKRKQRRRMLLEQEKIGNELRFLKAQINPHFLFNMLNNLYSFVLLKSEHALLMITKLTEIIEYALTESQKHFVPLEQEVNAILNYIELEKLRYGDRLSVEISINQIDALLVSPLIILSIIENAFKHGASGDIGHPKIIIYISGCGQGIICKVWNTKSSFQGVLVDNYKDGVGLKNIKQQLNIIYPDKHTLAFNETDSSFEVVLKIDSSDE